MITDAAGGRVASGPARLGWHGVVTDGAGTMTAFHEVMVNDSVVA